AFRPNSSDVRREDRGALCARRVHGVGARPPDGGGGGMRSRAGQMLQPLLSVAAGLGLGLLVTAFAGENPFHVLGILMKSAFGSRYDFGMTLFYTTPLIFTGLSVALAF